MIFYGLERKFSYKWYRPCQGLGSESGVHESYGLPDYEDV